MLPAACLLLMWVFVSRYRGLLAIGDANRRTCFVVAFALFQVITVLITELSSVGHHYTRLTVSLAWAAVLLSLAVGVRGSVRRPNRQAAPEHAWAQWTRAVWVDAAAGTLVLAGMVAVLVRICLKYPPSNGDSMAYHLARVEHWIQNESVAAFPAHFLAQVELPPLMEYNLAILHLVTDTDRMDGFVQLTAVAICLLGASELARRLGLGPRGQIVTALLVITAPNFLLQATSTTNDDFNAAIGIVVLCLVTTPLGDAGWKRRAVTLGAVGGLVEISKGTLFALLGPVVLVLLLIAVRRSSKRYGTRITVMRSMSAVALASAAGLVIAGPFLARNLALFGSPGGPVSRATINDYPSLSNSLSNLLRQVSAQFLIGDGNGFEYEVSRAVVRPLGQLYDRLGQDPNNSEFAFLPNPDPFTPGDFSLLNRFEDVGANPWHTLLVVATMLILVVVATVGGKRRRFRLPLVLATALCLGFLAFGMTAKWSIYANRYYIPLLAAWSPLVAFALARVPKMAVRFVCAALVVACLPVLLDNYQRPLAHPVAFRSALEPYFVTAGSNEDMRTKATSYQGLAETLAGSNCRKVGIANQVVVEYPIWVALDLVHWKGTIEHVAVKNVSSQIVERADYRPCALIYQPDQRNYISVHPGMQERTFGNLTLFIDAGTLRRDR